MYNRLSSPAPVQRAKRAQSLVELAVTLPLMALLLLGCFDTTMLVWDKLIAGYAVRQGTRLASEIGGRQSNPTATQAGIDQKIVRNVLAVTSNWAYGSLQELDIYAATSPDGSLQSTDYQDQFDAQGNPMATQTLTLERRLQSPPNETAIGVRIIWKFTDPTGTLANFTFNEYCVMKMAPVLN